MAVISTGFHQGLHLTLRAAAPPRLRMTPELRGSAAAAVTRTAPSAGGGQYIVFGPPEQFPGDTASLVRIGTAGLLQGVVWGTVLDASREQSVDVQIQKDEWQNLLGVGLSVSKKDVTVVCRTLANTEIPQTGQKFGFDGNKYIIITCREIWNNRKVREMAVSGMRWDELADGPLHIPLPSFTPAPEAYGLGGPG